MWSKTFISLINFTHFTTTNSLIPLKSSANDKNADSNLWVNSTFLSFFFIFSSLLFTNRAFKLLEHPLCKCWIAFGTFHHVFVCDIDCVFFLSKWKQFTLNYYLDNALLIIQRMNGDKSSFLDLKIKKISNWETCYSKISSHIVSMRCCAQNS